MREPLLEPLLRRLRLRRVVPYIPRYSVLLDVGCGTSAAFLKSISPHIERGCGVDFKVEDLRFDNIQTAKMMLNSHLPFEDSSFDVVTMLAVLEHIDHEHEILREIYRVLVPGGKLILTVPSIWAQPVLEFIAYRLKLISEAEIRDHKRYYDRRRLEKVLLGVGGFKDFYHQYFQFWMNNFCVVSKGFDNSI